LGATGNPSLVVEQASFNQTISSVKWNRIDEIEISSGLNQSEVHIRCHWIGNDLLDFGYGVVATGIGYLARLVVNDPVADARFDAAEVRARKLVLLCGTVIVDRI
jgi:hypothetical protein